MISIELDGMAISDEPSFHIVVAEKLEFPNYYGKNLDSFDECLSDFLISYPDEDVSIDWTQHEKSKAGIGENRFTQIVEVIKDCTEEWKPGLKLNLL